MLPIADVPIDDRVVIACPEKGFQPRRACVSCPKCPHFQGVSMMAADGPWHKRYVVRCAHIVERRTQLIEVIEE